MDERGDELASSQRTLRRDRVHSVSPRLIAVSLHLVLVIVHVVASAITLGATAAYTIAISLAERAPAHLAFTIATVRRSDRVLAIPAFLVTLVTGVWITVDEQIPFDRFWIAWSLAIFAVILVVGFTVWGPVVRRELAALSRGGMADAEYPRLRVQARVLEYGTIAALVVIFALMVAKPR